MWKLRAIEVQRVPRRLALWLSKMFGRWLLRLPFCRRTRIVAIYAEGDHATSSA